MRIDYACQQDLSCDEFVAILESSGLADRRPVTDRARLEQMLRGANLIIVARDADSGVAVGVARSLTDFCYCCYLSDLAVDRAWQGRGIGRQLIEETRRAAGPGAMCLLLSAPAAVSFYSAIGMPREERAFMYPREQ